MAKVAIITRTQDRILFLERAIQSVLAQTEVDWQHVIVVDAGSFEPVKELTDKYMDQYNGRLILINNEVSHGMEAASNLGIKSSKSEYVVIHDDDDSWHPEFLAKTTAQLEAPVYPTIKGVITWSKRVDEEIEGNKIISIKEYGFNTNKTTVLLEDMAGGNFFPPISFLYKRDVFDEIGYYDETLRYRGDWEFNLRFLSHYDIHLIPEILANYHFRAANVPAKYGNSVVAGSDNHQYYDTLLKNRLLREDLQSGKFGLGTLIASASRLRILQDGQERMSEDTAATRGFIRKFSQPLSKLFKRQ